MLSAVAWSLVILVVLRIEPIVVITLFATLLCICLTDSPLSFEYVQPTLHKPGIMAHSVRVLYNPTQKTIRMHYASK